LKKYNICQRPFVSNDRGAYRTANLWEPGPQMGERRMADTPSQRPGRVFIPKWVRGPQDFIGGIVLMAVAALALWASSDLQGMHGFSFGAGTAPRICAALLFALGAAVMVVGIASEGPQLQRLSWRGPLFVSLAILFFAIAIRPLGLVISGLASFLIAALGSHETRWLEAIIVGILLTAGCALLFPYVLGLPMPLFPRFLVQ
jgi:putative tricarboxylic transport membrane protein